MPYPDDDIRENANKIRQLQKQINHLEARLTILENPITQPPEGMVEVRTYMPQPPEGMVEVHTYVPEAIVDQVRRGKITGYSIGEKTVESCEEVGEGQKQDRETT